MQLRKKEFNNSNQFNPKEDIEFKRKLINVTLSFIPLIYQLLLKKFPLNFLNVILYLANDLNLTKSKKTIYF